ncbi:Psf2-domain-containing protein [Clavulina sp. PMI_390]|nr:Psf2-domain-containing protein [Clavulina sp. PMI_390]
MSLPVELQPSLTPQELEFIACNHESIEIVPLFQMDRIRLISGIYGPFQPPKRATVPLWLAVNLKLKAKCNIIPPDWLSPDFLKQKVKDELSTEGDFTELPFRYMEIAKVLLDVASDDLPSPDRIRLHLKELREARQEKARRGLSLINHSIVDLENLCEMEINEIRPYFVRSMGIITHLHREPRQLADEDMDTTLT